LAELVRAQLAEVVGRRNGVEQRCRGKVGHRNRLMQRAYRVDCYRVVR
jgi:hypothetical protein